MMGSKRARRQNKRKDRLLSELVENILKEKHGPVDFVVPDGDGVWEVQVFPGAFVSD